MIKIECCYLLLNQIDASLVRGQGPAAVLVFGIQGRLQFFYEEGLQSEAVPLLS